MEEGAVEEEGGLEEGAVEEEGGWKKGQGRGGRDGERFSVLLYNNIIPVCNKVNSPMCIYGTCQKECNKCAAAALENMAAFAPLFSHQKCRTLMAKTPHFDGHATVRRLIKCRNTRIAVRLAKGAAIPYSGASCTNHKSVARFLSKSGAQI